MEIVEQGLRDDKRWEREALGTGLIVTSEYLEELRDRRNAIQRSETEQGESLTETILTREQLEQVRKRASQSVLAYVHPETGTVVMLEANNPVGPNKKQVLAPPRGAKFALLMIPRKNREHLIGDLEEEYRTIILPEYGSFRANVWYWVQTIQAVGFYVWPFLKRVLGMAAILKVIGR